MSYDRGRDVLKCDCCARQIVRGGGQPDKYVTYGPVTLLGVDTHACYECSRDPMVRDQHGLDL